MPARSWGRGIREVTGAVPSDRGSAAPALPRWIRDPVAADFASPERLAFEAVSGESGDGLAGCMRPFSRFQHALDLFYGQDQWSSALARPPRWPGSWMPGRRYDPAAYERLPGALPSWLAEAVEAWQLEQDAATRSIVAANVPLEHQAAMLKRTGCPPA